MATLTPNYNLSKPDASDQFDAFRQSYNDNMDIIDLNMGGGGGGGGHTIVDPTGTDMPQENKLQFMGAVSVSDDSVNGQTIVDVEGGGNYYLNTIYSTEEKKVGYWTDKKPLYQKTWLVPKSSLNSGETTYTHGDDLNIDTLVSVEGTVGNTRPLVEYHSSSTWACSIYNIGNNAFWIYLGSNVYSNMSASSYAKVTLRYTKTTDTPELNPQTGGVIYLPSIYSEEEKEVGVWRDNKPLYQKTIDLGSDKAISHTSWYNAIVSITNIENIAICWGMYSGGTYYPLMAYHTGDDVNVLACRANSGATVRYLTLRYTKSSDTAGSGTWTPSGANAVHYSTNEHVVGTYIDGKPLYEITVDTGTLPNNTTKTVAHGISDLKAVIDFKGYGRNTNNGINIPIPYIYKSGSSTKCLQVYVDGTNINLVSMENLSGYTESYVTLQYTKTTD